MEDSFAQYLLQKNKDNYDLIAENFSATGSHLWPDLIQFKDWVEDGDHVIDLGCGNGRLLDLFNDKDIFYVGLDSSPRLIKIAQKEHPDYEFIIGDITEVTFPTDTFDKAFAIAFLHHIPSEVNRLNILAETRRILKPAGLLFLTVWAPTPQNQPKFFKKSKKIGAGDFIYSWGGREDLYYHLFKPKELIRLTRKAGLDIIQQGKLGERTTRKNFYLLAQKT